MTDMTVSKTILEQLGGGQFIRMTGAKDFIGGENTLSFRLPGAGGFTIKGINRVGIVLNAQDTYDIRFCRVRGSKLTVISQKDGIYVDQLREVFTRETGLAVSFGTMGRK